MNDLKNGMIKSGEASYDVTDMIARGKVDHMTFGELEETVKSYENASFVKRVIRTILYPFAQEASLTYKYAKAEYYKNQ